MIAQLDLSAIYARYAPVGRIPIAPEILLGLLFYGYATGVFSSRKIERATDESIPFRFIASGLHPDHDTIANFRKTFLAEIQELFVQILLLAQETGVFKQALLTLGEQADQGERTLPDGLVIADELTLRQERLANLAKAKAVLEARAQERFAAEQTEYQAKLRGRAEKAQRKGRKPGGRPPQPPTPGPREQDQYNFTDPDSRITPAPTAGAV